MSIVKQQFLFIFVSCLSVICVLLISNEFKWTFEFGDHRASLLMHYALINFFYIISRRTITSIFTSQYIAFLISFINIKKEEYLSTSLIPSDFLLFKESLIATPLILQTIILLLLIVFTTIFYLIYKKETKESVKKFIASIIIFFNIISFFTYANFTNNFSQFCLKNSTVWICEKAHKLPNTKGNWLGNHFIIKEIGYPTFFVSKTLDILSNRLFNESISVSKSEIEMILSNENQNIVDPKLNTNTLPNIIIIMNEAFWDPTKISPSIPQNITPNINKQTVTNFLSPTFGGSTAQVEFEILTSLNTHINQNQLAYTSQITRPIFSLPNYMNNLGYSTIAIHNNDKHFFNRNIVYKNLGFEKFISLEKMIDPSSRKKFMNDGGWITDEILYTNIINILNNDALKPKFIFAITVENHFSYNDDRFGKNNFNFNNIDISSDSKRILNTYLSGLKRADQQFKILINEINKNERPTVLIFLGDHLPNLDKVYDEFKFFKNNEEKIVKNNEDFFKTPLAIWSSFPIDKNQFSTPTIAGPFLAPRLLSAVQIQLPSYYRFIKKVDDCYTKIHHTGTQINHLCKNGDILLKQYKHLHSDILNGKNFTFELTN